MNKIFEKTKNIINIIFTFIFIIVLIYIMISSRTNNRVDKKEKVVKDEFYLLESNNFKYHFVIDLDGQLYSYFGEKNNDREKVVIKHNNIIEEYIIFKDFALKKNGDHYITANTPYIIINFFSLEELKNLIKKATFSTNGNLIIKNANLIKKVETQTSFDPLGENKINIIYTNKYITGIEADLTAFSKAFNNHKKMTLNLKYYDFNKVNYINIK